MLYNIHPLKGSKKLHQYDPRWPKVRNNSKKNQLFPHHSLVSKSDYHLDLLLICKIQRKYQQILRRKFCLGIRWPGNVTCLDGTRWPGRRNSISSKTGWSTSLSLDGAPLRKSLFGTSDTIYHVHHSLIFSSHCPNSYMVRLKTKHRQRKKILALSICPSYICVHKEAGED